MVNIGLDNIHLFHSKCCFSGSTREILARGAIPSLNNPVKSRPPLAAVARRRELAPQIIDVSFPVVYRNFIIQERRYGQYSF